MTMPIPMPPMVARVHVAEPDRRPVRLWLPLFLLWPLMALLLALPLLIAAIVDVALWLAGQRYHHYSVLIVRTLALLGDTKDTTIRVRDGRTFVDITIR